MQKLDTFQPSIPKWNIKSKYNSKYVWTLHEKKKKLKKTFQWYHARVKSRAKCGLPEKRWIEWKYGHLKKRSSNQIEITL